ncbi:hypothetical protein B9Z55_003174 [Caenorhabditis nigoni]|uniref:SXP/RAL-2 family protein Ani s 5-like cation-binding domain-containing protein n=1 Tax=Caenorhabditis nigoni TaxID=1611254 RepID=A0A2G5VP91_9PELO|nr:hypothetical protein B9Z55_003174 [Caenorhabditis nigoni]
MNIQILLILCLVGFGAAALRSDVDDTRDELKKEMKEKLESLMDKVKEILENNQILKLVSLDKVMTETVEQLKKLDAVQYEEDIKPLSGQGQVKAAIQN